MEENKKGKQVIVVLDVDALNEETISHEELGKQVRRMFASVNSGNNTSFLKFVGFCNTKNQQGKDLLIENLQNAVRETEREIIYLSIDGSMSKESEARLKILALEFVKKF